MGTVQFLGQVIIWFVVTSLAIILNHEQVPGNKNICDAGQGEYGFAWLIFIISLLYLLISSWKKINKNQQNKYNQLTFCLSVLLIVISFLIRPFIFTIWFGAEKCHYENLKDDYTLMSLKLFENGKFYSWSYDASCQIENTGQYELNGRKINLIFAKGKPKYFGTEYLIENNELECLDCGNKKKLKIKTEPNMKD